MKFYFVLLILCVISYGCNSKEDVKESSSNQTFVATKEWQEIPEGQGIPRGLHIRINLETGKKEAKLLDKSEEEESNASAVGQGEAALSVVPQEQPEKSPAAGGAKSKKVKHLDDALQRIGIDYSPEEKLENNKREFRSYEELKKTFDSMKKSFKTDAEIIVQLIEEFHNLTMAATNNEHSSSKDPESRLKTQIQILESFNYLMSQYDNALLFVDNGGLEQVLLPVLVNQTHVGMKVEAMRVLGAMSQNNPKVQIKVYERNVGSHLTQILMTSSKTDELSTALYAFSSLLRKFPHAQQKILSTSGTQALVSVLSKECELKIKAKAATMIADILVEKELVLSESTATDDPLAAAQYAELNFPEWLQANSYCETMDSLVQASLYDFLEAADILEYFLYTLENSKALCATLWSQSSQMRHTLLTLKNRYSQSNEEYRLEIAQLLNVLAEKLYPIPPVSRHDEF